MKRLLLSVLFILIGCGLYEIMCFLLNVKPNIELWLLIMISIDVKQSSLKD
jgi:hypothetical protein